MTAEDYELLSAYIDNMLEESDRSALEARLQVDNALRAELDALRQTIALVQSLPTLKAPRDFTLTPEMVGMSIKQSRKVLRFPLMPLASAAASFLLIAAGILLLIFSNDPNTTSDPMLAMPPTIPSTQTMVEPVDDEAQAGLYSNITPGDIDNTADMNTQAMMAPVMPMSTSPATSQATEITMQRAVEATPSPVDQANAEEMAESEEADIMMDFGTEEDAVPNAPSPQIGGATIPHDEPKDYQSIIPPPLPDEQLMQQLEAQSTQATGLVQDTSPETQAQTKPTDSTTFAFGLLAVGVVLLIISVIKIYRWRLTG
ncbi:MAG: hypothetical protein CUN56_10810 [Phototrophicales bacterium]|nr:MAG: hypothetical protein CUN56_10810 [Phototrophicales bacterium]RMG77558.1 MAG: hypothetical protein D6711_01195 [Chloroflexota bacterium]